jgi:uncharacterized protein YbaP (TraB family)
MPAKWVMVAPMKRVKRFHVGPNWVWVLAALSVGQLAAQPATASRTTHPLWEARGKSNRVYLLGSIHFAKNDFYPLAKPIEEAYERSSLVVFEANLGAMKSMETQASLLKAGVCPPGETLSQQVAQETYSALQAWLKNNAVPPSMFDQMKPWLASVTLVALELQKLGFNPNQGIDEHFYSRAKGDKKEIRGLETVDFQIDLFAKLSREDSELFLKSMLDDTERFPKIFADVIEAWKTGDAAKLEPLLLEVTKKYPAIYKKFLTDRNRVWLPQIEELLTGEKDVFVVVGMAHLVGSDGVVQLLKKKGVRVEQL